MSCVGVWGCVGVGERVSYPHRPTAPTHLLQAAHLGHTGIGCLRIIDEPFAVRLGIDAAIGGSSQMDITPMLSLLEGALFAKEPEGGASNDTVVTWVSTCVPDSDSELRIQWQVPQWEAEINGRVPFPCLFEVLEGCAEDGGEWFVGRVEAEGEVEGRVWSARARMKRSAF